MGLIFFLSSQPKLPEIPGLGDLFARIDWSDKIKHFAGYGVLAALVWRALGDGCSKWRRLLLTVVISTVYGMTDEYHQRFVPNRTCDICDLAADALGALFVATVIWKGTADETSRTARSGAVSLTAKRRK